MKLFQVENNICYWDATPQFPNLESTIGYFPPDLLFVEAPDYVFEGWSYIDGEFIEPVTPDGFLYDRETGAFYKKGEAPPEPQQKENNLEQLLDALIE